MGEAEGVGGGGRGQRERRKGVWMGKDIILYFTMELTSE